MKTKTAAGEIKDSEGVGLMKKHGKTVMRFPEYMENPESVQNGN